MIIAGDIKELSKYHEIIFTILKTFSQPYSILSRISMVEVEKCVSPLSHSKIGNYAQFFKIKLSKIFA